MSLCYAPYGHLFKSHVNVIQTRNNVFILFFTVTGCFFHSCARGACVLNPTIRQEYNNKKTGGSCHEAQRHPMFIFTLSDKAGFTQLLDKQQALNKVTNGCVLLLHSEMVTIKIPEEKNKVHQSRGHRCIFTAGPRVCKERLMWWEKCWLHEHDMTQKTRSRVMCMPEIYYSRGQPPQNYPLSPWKLLKSLTLITASS